MHAAGTHPLFFAALALSAAAATPSVRAQDDSAQAAQACINSAAIHHTTVLDDRTILFFMRNHATYRNTLSATCPGLNTEKRFIYGQSSLNTVCKGSVINVLYYGFGEMTRGASCWLGAFEPLSQDEVEELVAIATPAHKNPKANRRHAITSEPVELPAAAPARPSPADAAAPAAPGAVQTGSSGDEAGK